MIYQYKKTINEFELGTMNMEIESFCERNEVPASKLFAIQLIIEELVSNIIKYGKGKSGKATIDVELHRDGEQIRLCISDNSGAFNPLEQEMADTKLSAQEREIGGLGLFLVRKKVKSLSYEYKDGNNKLIAEI